MVRVERPVHNHCRESCTQQIPDALRALRPDRETESFPVLGEMEMESHEEPHCTDDE